MPKLPRAGLALGGGGARGWAHIGVIEALQAAGIAITCVAGTSMGALVGAAFAAGRLEDLKQVALGLDWKRALGYFAELSLPSSGLIDGRRIQQFLRQYIGVRSIESLPLPFAAVATDIETGREVVLREGNLVEAVRASIAIPGLISAVARPDAVLVDGGLVNPIPVNVARMLGAEWVVAVDVVRAPLPMRGRSEQARATPTRRRWRRPSSAVAGAIFDAVHVRWADVERKRADYARTRHSTPGLMEVFGNSARIVQRQIADMRLEREPPDLLIQPDVQSIHTMDFHRAAEAIEAGARAGAMALASLGAPMK